MQGGGLAHIRGGGTGQPDGVGLGEEGVWRLSRFDRWVVVYGPQEGPVLGTAPRAQGLSPSLHAPSAVPLCRCTRADGRHVGGANHIILL